MDPIADNASQRCHLPGMRSVSSTSSPTDLTTEDRRLPPLPPIEPLQRDLFNPFSQRNYMPSPPSTHETYPVRWSWPPDEHVVPPLSPATTADSWADPRPPQRSLRWPLDPAKMSADDIINLVAPDEKLITRKPPLQQPCGRKRKATMMLADSDEQREKHRVAEGNRRKNLSSLLLGLDFKLHDFWLELAGWNPSKSQAESKEHIVQAAIYLISFMRLVIVWLVCDAKKNKVPHHLQEEMHAKLRCMQLERQIARLIHQEQKMQHDFAALERDYGALEERNRALEYQLNAREHMFRPPQSEHLSPQQVAALPDSTAREMVPGMRIFGGEPDSARLNALSIGSSRSFRPSFATHTPSTSGPSSPVSQQGTYPITISRPASFIQSP
ncbi:putative HLH DNA binding domain protein [Aspergillus undulatus]|uniref:putative HLH DNA binding domain protein n=1 Tax=Aspergillus undulatus TaxID=1810928 RepID=UPI003CCD9D18